MRIIYYRLPMLFAILVSIGLVSNAQKLPNIQPGTMRAPINIKIDGKSTEWYNKFQAYNHATDVYYTISNDKDRLYLIVQATDAQVIRHIIGGGITLTLSKSKNAKNNITITYPQYDKNVPILDLKHGFEEINQMDPSGKKMDSLVNTNNKRMNLESKYIKVIGIPAIDTLISIYNNEGIKVAALFNNHMAYTYELAIDLKHLGIIAGRTENIYYNIRLNEVVEHGINITRDAAGNITGVDIATGAQQGQPATDFWGEYILTKN